MDKIPLPAIRHSKDLTKAIEKTRQSHQGAQQSIEEGKWCIRDGEALLGGPSETQWGAWMEAAYGHSRPQ